MARQIKCKWCQTKRASDTMIQYLYSTDKRTYKYYFCNEQCKNEFIADKEFKKKERQEKDNLVDTIMQVHRIPIIPSQFYPYLEELRNGDVVFGKIKKKYKEGVPYSVIRDTYLYCQKDILWAKETKDFKGSTLQELKYGLAIVKDKISLIYKRHQQQKRMSDDIDDVYIEQTERDVIYNKKDNDGDISQFLDE